MRLGSGCYNDPIKGSMQFTHSYFNRFFFPQIGCYGRSPRSKFKFLRPFQNSDLGLTCGGGGLNRCKPRKEMVRYSVDYGSVMINKKERKR